jgi:hypothetical protein
VQKSIEIRIILNNLFILLNITQKNFLSQKDPDNL